MSLFIGFTKRYHEELEEEIAVLKDCLCYGNVADWAEYKRVNGRLVGLEHALQRHKELLTLMEQANGN